MKESEAVWHTPMLDQLAVFKAADIDNVNRHRLS
jgi:hypothetical protein